MRLLPSLFVLALCVTLSSAGFTTIRLQLDPHDYVWQKFGVYSLKDAPFGDKDPFLSLHLSFSIARSVSIDTDVPIPEIVVLSHELRSEVGLYSGITQGTRYCCTEAMVAAGNPGCPKANRMVIHDKYSIEDFEQKHPGHFFYFNAPLNTYNDITHSRQFVQTVNISVTSLWYLFIANCGGGEEKVSLSLSGIIEWKNPFGYLPGQIAPNLLVYWSIAAALLLLFLVWLGFAIKYRDGLMILQYSIGLVILLFAIEQIVWGVGMIAYNKYGRIYVVVSVVGAFFKAVKNTSIRVLLLLVGLGVSITHSRPTRIVSALVALIACSYFLIDLGYEYVRVAEEAGEPIGTKMVLATSVALFVIDIVVWTWTIFATYMTMAELREKKETFKHQRYMWLVGILLVSLSLSFLLLFFEGAMENSMKGDDYWTYWWIWFVYWDCIYFFCVLVIFLLWRPRANNAVYAYSSQLPSEDNGKDSDSSSTNEKEEKLEEGSGGERGGDEEEGAVELENVGTSSSDSVSLSS